MAEVVDTSIRTLPLLALKNSALFPGLMMPLAVGRKSSVAAVDAAIATEEKELVVVAQRDAASDVPHAADVYTVGTRATIRRHHHARPDQLDIMVLGVERVVIMKVEEEGYLHARIRPLPLPDDSSRETEALTLSLMELGTKFLQLAQGGNIQQDIAPCSRRSRTRCNWRS
jgi:ATP-dependent Lon protease